MMYTTASEEVHLYRGFIPFQFGRACYMLCLSAKGFLPVACNYTAYSVLGLTIETGIRPFKVQLRKLSYSQKVWQGRKVPEGRTARRQSC